MNTATGGDLVFVLHCDFSYSSREQLVSFAIALLSNHGLLRVANTPERLHLLSFYILSLSQTVHSGSFDVESLGKSNKSVSRSLQSTYCSASILPCIWHKSVPLHGKFTVPNLYIMSLFLMYPARKSACTWGGRLGGAVSISFTGPLHNHSPCSLAVKRVCSGNRDLWRNGTVGEEDHWGKGPQGKGHSEGCLACPDFSDTSECIEGGKTQVRCVGGSCVLWGHRDQVCSTLSTMVPGYGGGGHWCWTPRKCTLEPHTQVQGAYHLLLQSGSLWAISQLGTTGKKVEFILFANIPSQTFQPLPGVPWAGLAQGRPNPGAYTEIGS